MINLVEAVRLALARALDEDEHVVLLGEDIGVNGGVFRATDGLQARFGEHRVLDMPLAEAMIAGVGIGMATQGLKPVLEFQFMGFIYPALNQLISHAARMRNRTRGRLHCPLVCRTPFGAGIHAPEHHSESTEHLFTGIPGLRVLVPSSPQQAYGLLLAAIDDPDPVIFLEPTRLYRLAKEAVVDDGQRLPLDRCRMVQAGHDVTLITWGACIHEVKQAAVSLAHQGISCEIVDVVTLKPLDVPSLVASVMKTGRCLIVHEASLTGGLGGEIAALLAEQAFYALRAPVRRLTGYDVTMPYFQMEKHVLLTSQAIVQAVCCLMQNSLY